VRAGSNLGSLGHPALTHRPVEPSLSDPNNGLCESLPTVVSWVLNGRCSRSRRWEDEVLRWLLTSRHEALVFWFAMGTGIETNQLAMVSTGRIMAESKFYLFFTLLFKMVK
jgi:hypothetical protein